MEQSKEVTMETIEVTTPRCIVCGQASQVTVVKEAYLLWRQGELIQRAMPEMPVETRELLITGTHPACWDRL
jgi:hypothetical protein